MTALIVPDTATVIDVEIHQYETWNFDFEVVDRRNAPFPTAGCTVEAVARPALDTAAAAYFTWSGAKAIPSPDSPTAVRLLTTSAETGAWLWRSAVYDVRVTDTGGNVGYIAKGTITVIAASTY